jgi:hypothetical protein
MCCSNFHFSYVEKCSESLLCCLVSLVNLALVSKTVKGYFRSMTLLLSSGGARINAKRGLICLMKTNLLRYARVVSYN